MIEGQEFKFYVADTHSLIWYTSDAPQLSKAANDAFREAEEGKATLIILVIALAEVVFISEKRRVQISLEEVLRKVEGSDNFLISPLKVEHILQLVQLTSVPEMHDRLMVAEARLWNAALITKDETIRGLGIVPTIW